MTLSILLGEAQQTPPLLFGCWSMILEKRAPPKSFHFFTWSVYSLYTAFMAKSIHSFSDFWKDQGPYIQVLVCHGAQKCILLARVKKCSIRLLEPYQTTYLPGEARVFVG